MNYMVLECHPGYAVVLSDDGRFLKVANMHYEVGQTITNIIELHLPQREQPVRKNNRRWISSLAAMAACLALVVTFVFFRGQMPYASVYMTINPEVRIDVNRNDIVVGVEGMNADGADLLADYNHSRKDLDTVMDELVDLAIDMGYLHQGGKITLSLDADEEWVISHGEHLNQHLNEYLTDRITVTIDVEQKQPEQPASTAATETIGIPRAPDSYGNSDYSDDTDDGTTSYGVTDNGASADDAPDNNGQTDYEDPADDGQTDYGASSDHADGGKSEYHATEAADTDDGESDYASSGDGQSAYDDPDDDSDDSDDDDED